MEEIRFILNCYLYDDVSKHILSFLIVECCNCEQDFFEEQALELYNCKYACKMCIRRERYNMCKECQLFYGISSSDCCIICERDDCYLYRYCPICKFKKTLETFDGIGNILIFRELIR